MTRPRGFAEWNPRPKALDLVSAINVVLDQYRSQLPLTLRQIFYRLVATGKIGKTERDYKRLCETATRARRAMMLSFDDIRDDGYTVTYTSSLKDLNDATSQLRDMAADIDLDLQYGQESRLYCWVEAQGMVPQIRRVAAPYGISVISSGGFDSVTAKYELAMRFQHDGVADVLHIGDYDPSGVHVFQSLAEDIDAFTRDGDFEIVPAFVEFHRIAILPEQAAGLPSAPPKATDRRSFSGYQTWQAEALPPDVLAAIVEDEIRSRIDFEQWQTMVERQSDVRQQLAEAIHHAS